MVAGLYRAIHMTCYKYGLVVASVLAERSFLVDTSPIQTQSSLLSYQVHSPGGGKWWKVLRSIRSATNKLMTNNAYCIKSNVNQDEAHSRHRASVDNIEIGLLVLIFFPRWAS